jgi:hypothetical protein
MHPADFNRLPEQADKRSTASNRGGNQHIDRAFKANSQTGQIMPSDGRIGVLLEKTLKLMFGHYYKKEAR